MKERWRPAYLKLVENGGLKARAARAVSLLRECTLCPHCCRSNRFTGATGSACRTGRQAVISSYGPHHGEETPLVGQHGSGTIFFGNCNLHCVFCQNWEISQRGDGREVSATELAEIMLQLQKMGCHNINLVTPSHVVAQFLEGLATAAERGLHLPIVFNTGGYDSQETLALLDGVIDIYMPDMKFADAEMAQAYLGVADYPQVNQDAVREMHRQVGDLVCTDDGIARRGLLVRHLVMPGNQGGTEEILAFIAEEISPMTYLNLMDQFRPCYSADDYPPLGRKPSRVEINRALKCAKEQGLERLDRSGGRWW